jgi:hypothetical protein|tara:strand:+ start:515 stop:817 length:303 start_codon:yes stop_codon:yes gene_type:complete
MSAEPKFTLKQVLCIVTVAIAASGGGAAYTVSASDAVQDSRIEAVEKAVDRLKVETSETHDSVLVVGAQTEHIAEDVAELKDDTKDIQRLLNRLIERTGG